MRSPASNRGRRGDPAGRPGLTPLVAIAVVAIAGAAGTVLLRLAGDNGGTNPELQGALLSWVILTSILSGLVAWRQRPQSRFGPLMILAGFTVMLACLAAVSTEPAYTFGQALDMVPFAVFLHLYLAFPTGRLRGPGEVALVAAAYVVAVGMEVVELLLGGFKPDNAIAVLDEPAFAADLFRIQNVLMALLSFTALGILMLRRRPGGRRLRPTVEWLIRSFSLALLLAGLTLLVAAFDVGSSLFVHTQWVLFVVVGLAPFVFLYALLDARLARSSVGDLLVELQAEPPPSDLEAPLARALHDPSVALAYWLPRYGLWADGAGAPVELPSDDEQRSVTVIDRDGEHLAALVHDRSLDDERELLEAVSAAAGIALENARLQAELQAKLRELERSRERVLAAGQQERKRLERNLHDGAQQRLVALSLELGMLEDRISDVEARERIEAARGEIAASLEELRAVAHGLYPAVLTSHGLAVAVKSLAETAPVPVDLDLSCGGRLDESVEVAAYYVVNESLANIGKHAHARQARVSIDHTASGLVVEIADDGVGGADSRNGSGLRGLADRVEALGGELRVSTLNGGGTVVHAEMPCG